MPLSDLALSIIESAMAQEGRGERDVVFGDGARARGGADRGFSGWSKAKLALDCENRSGAERGRPRSRIEPWILHDLRRTAATRLGDLGVLPHVIEATLNHVSGFRAGVAGVYNKASYAAEKRQALDRWAAHIESLVAGQASNIVALRA